MNTAATQDFRVYLQQVLLERCRKNNLYSLRAFAKSFNMSPATVSHLLRGTRPITDRTQTMMAEALGLGPLERAKFKIQQDKRKNMAKGIKLKKKKLETLSADVFEVISDWIHDAILELVRIEGFKGNNVWIARKLGVAPHEINVAVERLKKLELLEIDGDGKWISHAENSTILENDEFTSVAARKLQGQILELSMKALNEIPRAQRDHSSSLMTVAESDLKEIKNKIRKFRRELLAFAERKEAKAERLYQLSLGFFPIDKK